MKAPYQEEDLLALSGIQHFAYCPRQWALIHVEQQWAENVRTFEGRMLHQRADDSSFCELRGDVLITRSLSLVSYQLGIYGVADVVEFHKSLSDQPGCIQIPGRDGWWKPCPVEYKRGRPKADDWDRIQLCAQAICLEEMLGTIIESGSIYYGETRHRVNVIFDDVLRSKVKDLLNTMHEWMASGTTPRAIKDKKCRFCSLKDICLPQLGKDRSDFYLKNYLQEGLEEVD